MLDNNKELIGSGLVRAMLDEGKEVLVEYCRVSYFHFSQYVTINSHNELLNLLVQDFYVRPVNVITGKPLTAEILNSQGRGITC